MSATKKDAAKPKKKHLHFSILIFAAGMLLTIMLWDAYFNGERQFEREIASNLIFIMGTLFAISAGLFSWSLESRHSVLEREVERRTRELNEKNVELEQKKAEVENFIHIVSHDLKAPIVSIQGFATILKEELGPALQGAGEDCFNRIVANAKQMNMFILDLLEFSRVGRIEEDKEIIDPKDTIQEVLAILQPEISKKKIKIEITGDSPKLLGSKKRFEQVVSNLIGNAVKYIGTPAEPRIDIGCSGPENGFCTIRVKDNGIGIKKEYHEKIFQMFQRVPNRLKVEGSGIGLSIVKKIVDLNGGVVTVESEEGKGSSFSFSWPEAESDVADAKPGELIESGKAR
jgi:signal transduction histidine kinase